MKFDLWHRFRKLIALLEIPAPERPQLVYRIKTMERAIILPVKAAGIGMLLHSFYVTPWISLVSSTLDVAYDTTLGFFWFYFSINLAVAALLLLMSWLPLVLVEWAVFVMSLVDGLFLAALTSVTGGYDSFLYWLFLGLIVRSAVSVPRATAQLMLNFWISGCYVLAGEVALSVTENVDETTRRFLESTGETAAEPLLLRLPLILPLLLMTVSCYIVQVLLDRQRKALEQAREYALREGQLHAAGRLAAEFAHQIKNPLAIITNAAFSLQRNLKEEKGSAGQQVKMIQEEVERADRIITQIMGYAQLSEGRVEKVNVLEELNRAIAQVFPPGSHFKIQVHRDFERHFPPLLMLRRHVTETFVNLLLNAREALDGHGGNVFIKARCHGDYSIEVNIWDDGPGIPADKHEKIFDAYYTTKEKGTGLGLALVKHNVELYGGRVTLESELGKGARFSLLFPARTIIRLDQKTRT